ncbi:MAG: phosphatase PAP2 family protein [Opitutaceae bacterium]|jgi:undecaprenyl-diphosphatase
MEPTTKMRWRMVGGWFVGGLRVMGRWALPLGLTTAVVLAFARVLALSGADRSFADWLMTGRPEGFVHGAYEASHWGELQLAPLLGLLVLLVAGRFFKQVRWVWGAFAGVFAGASAGLLALVLKFIIGRPRPYLHVANQLSWFARSSAYESFPSGHTTHCFAVAAAVVVLAPSWGVLFMAGATVVAWSRLYLWKHYLSDVLAGAGLGVLIGVAFALAVRRWLEERAGGTTKKTAP